MGMPYGISAVLGLYVTTGAASTTLAGITTGASAEAGLPGSPSEA